MKWLWLVMQPSAHECGAALPTLYAVLNFKVALNNPFSSQLKLESQPNFSTSPEKTLRGCSIKSPLSEVKRP